jgi:hypothetical protein
MDCDAPEAFDCTIGPVALRVELPAGGLISGIGTGALVWNASLALATALFNAEPSILFSEGRRDFAAMRAIELGCGCSALPSFALALAGAPHVVATDVAAVLPSLRANLASTARAGAAPRACDAIEPRALAWDDPSALAALVRGDAYDLVLCADVDWMESLHEALLDCLAACLAPTTCSLALIATTSSARGRDSTLEALLRRAAGRGFVLSELSTSLELLSEAARAANAPTRSARIFALRWPSESTAQAARARFDVERAASAYELLAGLAAA